MCGVCAISWAKTVRPAFMAYCPHPSNRRVVAKWRLTPFKSFPRQDLAIILIALGLLAPGKSSPGH